MIKSFFIQSAIILSSILLVGFTAQNKENITPNQFKGSDTQRIQAAVDKAAKTTGKVVIPAHNSNGSGIWLLDSAVLLPSNITVILDNCTVQLSDSSRDNMFRSDNVGLDIKNPKWNENIKIIGIGEVTLKGANNPRSTGDASKTLSINCEKDKDDLKKAAANGGQREYDSTSRGQWEYDITYGSDAGIAGRKQTGDWRNIMILIAYVDGFKLNNVKIEKTHAWAVSHERVLNGDISDIRINNPGGWEIIDGKRQYFENRDGINLRHGCKNFRIDNISGVTGDDFVALSLLGVNLPSELHEVGILNSTMVTSRKWHGTEDDIERVVITNINCKTPQWGIAIRANDMGSINNVYINGLFYESTGRQTQSFGDSQFFKYDDGSLKGRNNASIKMGGRGYGNDSQPGKINNIHAKNIFGNGGYLVYIGSSIANCSFTNGIYNGDGKQTIISDYDHSKTTNIITQDLIKIQ